MVAERNDARLLSFPGGQHTNPENAQAWIAGCLGIVDSCSPACEMAFAACIEDQSGADSANFETCEGKIASGGYDAEADCSLGCAPTLHMLEGSERPTVHLSEGTFGTQTDLAKHDGTRALSLFLHHGFPHRP